LRPVGKGVAQPLLAGSHPLGAGDLDRAAPEGDLGFRIEGAQELALPASPDAWADRLDVRDGENEEQLQALHGLDHVGEAADRGGVREIAALRHVDMSR
jgi:hypothetical protein